MSRNEKSTIIVSTATLFAALSAAFAEETVVAAPKCPFDGYVFDAETANRSFENMDWRMCMADSGYKYSHERLAVLRSVKDTMAHPSLYQYITNSIRELVEYPESDLIHFQR